MSPSQFRSLILEKLGDTELKIEAPGGDYLDELLAELIKSSLKFSSIKIISCQGLKFYLCYLGFPEMIEDIMKLDDWISEFEGRMNESFF